MAGPGYEIAAGAGGRGHLRASHADREQAIGTLKAAFVQGMLAKDEFDLRVGHNEAGLPPTSTDRGRGGHPGQRRFPTTWAYLTSEPSIVLVRRVSTIMVYLGGFPSQAVVVLADDSLAVAGHPTHAGIGR